MHTVEASPNGYIYKTLLNWRLGEQCKRGGRKIVKSQRIMAFALRLYLLVTSETMLKIWRPKHELNKGDTNEHAKVDKKSHKNSLLHKATGNWGDSRGEHNNWLSTAKWSVTVRSVYVVCKQWRLMKEKAMNLKDGRGVCRISREEREGRNVIFLFSKNKTTPKTNQKIVEKSGPPKR